MLSVIEAHYYVRVRTAGRSRLLPYEDFTTTFRGGLAPRRETVTGDYHHGGIGLPAYCPGIDEPDPMIPWEQDLPRAC